MTGKTRMKPVNGFVSVFFLCSKFRLEINYGVWTPTLHNMEIMDWVYDQVKN